MSRANTERNKEPQVLYIDTSDSHQTIVGLDNERWKFKTQKHKSQELLSLIEKSLKKKKKTLKDLTAVEINLGPGSFTGLRVGVAVANALGWALGIPINDHKVGELVEPNY